jgi:hypothetical protein
MRAAAPALYQGGSAGPALGFGLTPLLALLVQFFPHGGLARQNAPRAPEIRATRAIGGWWKTKRPRTGFYMALYALSNTTFTRQCR